MKKSSEILPRWLPVMYSLIDKTWQVWQESKSCTGHTNLPNLIMDSNNAGEGKLSRTLKPVVKSPKVDYSSVSNSGTTPWQHPSHYWGRYCETVWVANLKQTKTIPLDRIHVCHVSRQPSQHTLTQEVMKVDESWCKGSVRQIEIKFG